MKKILIFERRFLAYVISKVSNINGFPKKVSAVWPAIYIYTKIYILATKAFVYRINIEQLTFSLVIIIINVKYTRLNVIKRGKCKFLEYVPLVSCSWLGCLGGY